MRQLFLDDRASKDVVIIQFVHYANVYSWRFDRNSIPRLHHPITTAQTPAPNYVTSTHWLQFHILVGRGDWSSIFIYVNVSSSDYR